MTPRYPGAFWRPDDGNRGGDGDLGRLPDVGTLHEAVSPNPTSVFGWVQSAKACHAYNGRRGYMEQYADFDRHVEGVADGNEHCITFESYDGLKPESEPSYHEVQTDDPAIYGTSANTGRWDPGQCERAADFIAWCEVVLGSIKAVEIPDSRPGQSGWAPHRWGIAPWRVPGGEVWTRHDGKPCPGDLRVNQIPGIVARAQQ
ncbi:MAG TPA: hypothetical protein VFM01_04650, partial [Nakamurella sp.]|nr:hypothetical protein [Nakamurella sp.]